MLPLLLFFLYWWSHTGASPETSQTAAREPSEAVQDDSKPYIYYCRSPNMETFTCWWHPLDNGLQGDNNITYRLVYTLGNRPPIECPDYVSGGPNSCHFDMKHTVIWEVYCMNVTAHSSGGGFSTSNQLCLDVVDIVEIDPPFNLTYTLNTTKHLAGYTVLVSWQYPIVQQVQIGWITLLYELRYRPVAEPDNWKVKAEFREPHLELNMPVGRFEVQVRCRSRNNHLWSKWSSSITIVIPSRPLPDHLLYVLSIMAVIVIIILLAVGFGIIPHSKRIKAFLLPPIPKPCIRGIDPKLLKNGKMDEINRHFASLQGYKVPHYYEASVYQQSVDEGVPLSRVKSLSSLQEDKELEGKPDSTENQQLLYTSDIPSPHDQDYSTESSELTMSPETPLPVCPENHHFTQPKLISFLGTAYSMIVNTSPTDTIVSPNPQEFYTCVHGVSASEMVQLVPCMSDSVKVATYFELKDKPEEDTKKLNQLAVFLEKQVDVQEDGEMRFYPVEPEQNAYVVPLLPQSTGGRQCVN